MAVVAAVILALGCVELSGELARPVGLPAGAFWLGGPDGGVFVWLKRQDDPGFIFLLGLSTIRTALSGTKANSSWSLLEAARSI